MDPDTPDTFPAPVKAAVFADGGALSDTALFLTGEVFASALPWLRVVGLCCDGSVSPPELPETFPPIYTSMDELLAKEPDLRFVFHASDSPEPGSVLENALPDTVTLLPPDTTRLFRDSITSENVCFHCRQELKRTRSLFYTLFDEMDEDLLLLDVDGRILNANRHVLEGTGLTPRDVRGRMCCDIDQGRMCPGMEAQGGCPLRRALDTGEKAECMHTFVDDDGRMRYFRMYAYPISENGSISHVILLRRDITARTHMEKTVQQSQTMASIGELATYIAHEIRNPLFAIGGFANSLLRTEDLPEEARHKASIILEESKRLDSILKATLNFTRNSEPVQSNVSLNDLIPETMKILTLGFADSGVEYAFHPSPAIALAKADPELVKQCLINLVKNASEALPEGGSLTIRTGMDSDMVFFRVEDNGAGIPKQIRDKVFNPFFSTKNKGSGLGLPLTKKIVEDMGGRIELETREGKGTRITILLRPVLAVDSEKNGSGPDADGHSL